VTSIGHFIMATAGHVDHGKSALVKALTGTDPDRLPEEIARGITIDLGFAHLELPGPAPSRSTGLGGPAPSAYSLGLIDVPGHEDFVKNMVAGVGSIDLALLIVAADDGWMPQTEEHLQILTYLGVRHAVVALTKIDLVPDQEPRLLEDLRLRLAGTPFAAAPIVATSVTGGRGLDQLRRAFVTMLALVPAPADAQKPRLPIDRAFALRGVGTVVTGTLTGGTLSRNQEVILQPSGKVSRIRSLQCHNRDVEQAVPGMRTALNLLDVPLGAAAGGASRGQVITVAELGAPTRTLDVWLEKSGRPLPGQQTAGRGLKDGTRVRFHHGSGSTPARVILIEGSSLPPGGQALAQIRTEKPVFVLGGDRFILRDWPEQRTLAGGLVLEPAAPRRAVRDEVRQTLWRERAQHPGQAVVWLQTQLRRERARKCADLLLQTRWGRPDVQTAVGQLAREKKIALEGEWALDAAWWQQQSEFAVQRIQNEHRMHPERPGLVLSDLRRALERQLPDPTLCDVLLKGLARQGYVLAGTVIRHQAHRLVLPPNLQAAGEQLRSIFVGKPFEPPPKKELMKTTQAAQALRFLIDSGEALEISPELVMLSEHYVHACELIHRRLQENGPATASELRQLLGTNRRVIIPLLERLDRDAITVRRGDLRELRINPSAS
jgi:selenocysteine-specific elongation factor